MQTLDIQVQVPEDHVLIKRAELEELRSQDLTGKIWEMKDLSQATRRSADWLKEFILYPYRPDLEAFVKYPRGKGDRWKFGAKQMSQWLEDHLEEVM